MKKTDNRSPENFFLPEGNTQHNIEPFTYVSHRKSLTGKSEKTCKAVYGIKKDAKGCQQGYGKNYLTAHLLIISREKYVSELKY